MARKKRGGDGLGAFGWRCYTTDLNPKLVHRRLKTCPLSSVKAAMHVIIKPFMKGGLAPRISFNRGLTSQDEIACGRWILYSKMPNEFLLSEENREVIFDWVRESL